MRESDYLSSISSSGPSARVTALLQQPLPLVDAGTTRDRIELFIERSGIPLAPLCYIALCVVASFFLFILALSIGPVTGVSAGFVTLYLGVVFLPLELFARRVRSAESELAGVAQAIGEQILRGHAPDHSVATTAQTVLSPELKQMMRNIQRQLLISTSFEGSRDAGIASCRGVVLPGFLAAIRYAATHSHEEGGTLCIEYARTIEVTVNALRRHAVMLTAARYLALFILAMMLYAALSTGFWSANLSSLSLAFFARDLGSVVLLLALVAVLRVTSLAEWEQYGFH